ncbi:MAG: DNA-3-methyladenine glycosylase 2 family protein [Bdellovibrionales bacterium]|nr:DNA-3-methyladenine glycosylase 2 family protein [Bdellovibrionales bacterium]
MSSKLKQFPKLNDAIKHLKQNDPVLAALIDEAGPMTVEIDPEKSIFDALARSIFYQQIHGKAAAAIMGRVKALCGNAEQMFTAEQFLSQTEASLRACGLSNSKFRALQDLATKVVNNELPLRAQAEQMSDDEVIAALTVVRGIGPWTVQMMLLFTFGRTDVWPVTDYGIRNGYSKVFGKRKMVESKKLETLADHWSPYRSVASWYLWRATEFERFRPKKKPAAKKPRNVARKKR